MQKIAQKLVLVGICTLLGLSLGCEQKQDTVEPAAAAAPVAPAAPAAPVAPAAPAAAPSVDYKAEAEKEVTADNAEAVADALEKELEAEMAE